MATFAAVISDTGIIAPSYADVLQQLKIIYWSIYGSDAILDDDSQDGQFLSTIAQAIFDCNQTTIDAYNSFSPTSARGVGLSSLVKINGIRRSSATNSTAVVTISGTVGTVINNGIVSSSVGDNSGTGSKWNMPEQVIIPNSGQIDVTVTAQDAGTISAAAGTLIVIATPTYGWQSVTNALAATPGQPVETDAELRARQTNSVALPAMTILEGIYAAIDNVTGVDKLMIYENDEDTADVNGLPPHSFSVVVSGGNVSDIVSAIALKKSPGARSNGTIVQTVFDRNGVPNIIRYYQLVVVPLQIRVVIHALTGYVSTTGTALCQAIMDFVNSLIIGEDSYTARLYSPANMTGSGLGATFVVTSITQARGGGGLSASDVIIAFNEGASITSINDIQLVLA